MVVAKSMEVVCCRFGCHGDDEGVVLCWWLTCLLLLCCVGVLYVPWGCRVGAKGRGDVVVMDCVSIVVVMIVILVVDVWRVCVYLYACLHVCVLCACSHVLCVV